MKTTSILALTALVLAPALTPSPLRAQTAGSTVLGVSAEVMANLITGWSAKRSILGKPVYSDGDKPVEIGSVEDIIVAPGQSVSYAIVNASKFLGLSSHDVAIPVGQFTLAGDRIVLPGATKDVLRAMPPFVYAKK